MQGFVAGAGQAGIALVDLDVGISLLEVGQVVLAFRGCFGWDGNEYILMEEFKSALPRSS